MTEVGPTDRQRLLRSKHDECSAIVTSRKRKLRQLFAVATVIDDLPNLDFTNPDAPPATPEEIRFLDACDILQGRKLNEINIPNRPKLRYDALKQSLATSGLFATENIPHLAENTGVESVATVDGRTTTTQDPSREPSAGEDGPRTAGKPSGETQTTLETPAAASQSPRKAARAVADPTRSAQSVVPIPTIPTVPLLQNKDSAAIAGPSKTLSTDAEDSEPTRSERTPSRGADSPLKASSEPGQDGLGSAPSGISQETLTRDAHAKQPLDTPSAAVEGDSAEGTGLLSIRLPHDGSKVPDVLSSPGSTTQTATTPAVHDVSTDTSPDNEGPRYVEGEAEKGDTEDDSRDGADHDDRPATQQDDSRRQAQPTPSDSAEAQLLKESMDAKSQALDTPSTISKPAKDTLSEIGPPGSSGDASVATTINATRNTGVSLNAEQPQPTSSATVPDSQGSSQSDEMDVDRVEPATKRVSADVVSQQPEKQPAPTQRTPRVRQPSQSTSTESPRGPERAVTRVSTGAIRQKSVSEILGETPRPTVSVADRAATKGPQNQLTPLTSTPKSPTSQTKNLLGKRKDKAKNQVSTVVFGKQSKPEEKSIVAAGQKSYLPNDDYFTSLFVQSFTQNSKWMKPIEVVLNQAHKTISTDDAQIAIKDNQACKVLRRVYHLQQHDKWSLRQPKRVPEAARPPSHWDVVLQEMKWMRTDFREERKWKMAVARNLVYACAEWVAGTVEERKALQVKAVIPPMHEKTNADVSMADVDDGSTPDLVASATVDSPEHVDELREEILETVAPSAIFSLQENDVVFGLRRSPTTDQLLDELPLYGSALKVPSFDLIGSQPDPDAHWRRPALPLSKYVEGQIKLTSDGPPRKRTRYEYEDSDEDDEAVYFGGPPSKRAKLPPTSSDVALFAPESKPIRDRLHAGHQFRPPSEHPMPLQNFYETRFASQWTWAEDEELRSLVGEYSYNWSLIASMLATKSLLTSAAERRTPWECFERWISLEGLPPDMQKTQYFKAYNNRIEAAQRVIQQQNQLAAQQQAGGSNGAVTPIQRRRPSTPLRVERRRNQKHLSLIEAMRKLAKKRETTAQKQHAAAAAASRKVNEATHPKGPTKTPRDYSLMRWERDQAIAEKMAQYAQRQEAQRKAIIARAQGQAAQIAGTPGATQATPLGVPNTNPLAAAAAAATRPNMPGQLAVPGQPRPRVPMPAAANGVSPGPVHMAGGLVPPLPINSIPQAQLQAIQAQQRLAMPNPTPDVQLMMQARLISEQQRQAVAAQQAQAQAQAQSQNHASPPVPQGTPGPQTTPPNMRAAVAGNGINQQNFLANAQAMMASFGANGSSVLGSPAAAGGLQRPGVPAGSPRAHVAQPQMALAPAIQNQLNMLEAQVRQKQPNVTPEVARQLAMDQLTRIFAMQRQTAMNAAAGAGSSPTLPNGVTLPHTSPHQYAHLLRQQQQQQAAQAAQAAQQAAAAAAVQASQHQRQASGSATPSVGK